MRNRKTVPCVGFFALTFLWVTSVATCCRREGKEQTSMSTEQQMKEAISDAVRTDGDGIYAKRACDTGLRIKNCEVLGRVLMNRNGGVRLYCLEKLSKAERPLVADVLVVALRNEELWKRQEKIGELAAEQVVFEERLRAVVADLLSLKSIEINFGLKPEREELIQKFIPLTTQAAKRDE